MRVKTFFNSVKVMKDIIAKADDAIGKQMVKEMRDEIREVTPVDTGRLKRSMKHEKTGIMKAQVSTKVPYAVWQEYGTAKGMPRAMMRKGAATYKNKGFKVLKNKLD